MELIEQAWEALGDDYFDQLIRSMDSRVNAVSYWRQKDGIHAIKLLQISPCFNSSYFLLQSPPAYKIDRLPLKIIIIANYRISEF